MELDQAPLSHQNVGIMVTVMVAAMQCAPEAKIAWNSKRRKAPNWCRNHIYQATGERIVSYVALA